MGVYLSETSASTWKSQGEYASWPLPFVLGEHHEKGQRGADGVMGPTPTGHKRAAETFAEAYVGVTHSLHLFRGARGLSGYL